MVKKNLRLLQTTGNWNVILKNYNAKFTFKVIPKNLVH